MLPASVLTGKDIDFDGDAKMIFDVDTTGLIGTLNTTVVGGVITALEYDPGLNFRYLEQGESVEQSFSYEVGDGNGGTTWATVTITIQGVANGRALEPAEIQTGTDPRGFAINGVAAGDSSGISVSGAGDVNGDGLDDLIVGA